MFRRSHGTFIDRDRRKWLAPLHVMSLSGIGVVCVIHVYVCWSVAFGICVCVCVGVVCFLSIVLYSWVALGTV